MGDLPNTNPGAHSAAVYRYAVELVEDTRAANQSRLADARDLAAVVRIADETAADRILSAAEEACARDLHIAEEQAEEVVRHARAGIMAAVQRYTDNLISESRRAGEARLGKASELAELVRLADSNAADRLLQAIHTVNEAALRTAERQAEGVLETAQMRLTIGSRPLDSSPAATSAPTAENMPPPPRRESDLGGDSAPAAPGVDASAPVGSSAGVNAPASGQWLGNSGSLAPNRNSTPEASGDGRPQEG